MENIADLGEPLKGGLLDNLSRFTGESPEATQRAFKGALPASMYAIADYGSSEAGAQSLLDGLNAGRLPELGVDHLPGVLGDPQATGKWAAAGGGFLDKILGDKRTNVLAALSQSSGVGPAAMWKIFSLAAPLAMGVIGKRVRLGNFDARSLSAFLGEQKSMVGMTLPSIFGRTQPATEPVARPRETARAPAMAPLRRDPQRPSMWPWALAGLAVALGLMMVLGKNRAKPQVQARTPPVTAPRVTPSPRNPMPATPEARSLGEELDTYFSGTEGSPRRFELRDYSAVDKGPADKLALALARHPEARVIIEAYNPRTTGGVTDEASALERAQEVKDQLISQGIAGERIEAVGKVLPDSGAPQRIDVVVTR